MARLSHGGRGGRLRRAAGCAVEERQGQTAWPRAVRVASPCLRLLCAIDTGAAPASQHLCGGRGRRREQRRAQSERPTSAGREAAGPGHHHRRGAECRRLFKKYFKFLFKYLNETRDF